MRPICIDYNLDPGYKPLAGLLEIVFGHILLFMMEALVLVTVVRRYTAL